MTDAVASIIEDPPLTEAARRGPRNDQSLKRDKA